MSTYKNTLSCTTTSTTTLALVPPASYYVKQTALENTINDLFEKLKDEFDNEDEKLEYINALIANQDANIENKTK